MIGQGNSVKVTSEESGARAPAWSPDGQTIAYLTSSGPMQGDLNLIPPLGGAARSIGKVSGSGSISWFPDGKSLCVAVWMEGRTLQSSISVLSVDGGESRRPVQPPETSVRYGDSDCAVSPSGTQLAFVRRFGPWEQDLFVVSLRKDLTADGAPHQLTNDHKKKNAPVWMPDNKELIYTAGNDADELRLYRVSASGKETPRRIDGIGEHARDLAISKDGRRLMYSKRIEKADMYRIELTVAGKHTAPQEFLSSTMYEGQPSWSPDGEHIAFASNRSGGRQIWVAESDGTNPRPLTSFVDSVTGTPQWSPDSQMIAFDARPGGNPDIYVVAASGGIVKRLTDDAAEDHVPAWSDDGRWICFASTRSGRDEIYRVSPAGGVAEQLTKSGAYAPIRLVAGRFLYYSGITPGMHRLDLQSGEDKVVAQGMQLGFAVHTDGFASVGRRDENGESPITFYRFSDGSTRVLTRLNRGLSASFALSPDLHWMVYGIQESSSDIRLVENFR
jgi:Tol biopolymer transport system component